MYETTDYVICAEHPVYGIFELGCWMCGFEDFLYRMALDEEWIHRFFERVLEYQKKVIQRYYTAVGPYIHYTSSGDDFATQNAPFVSPDMFRELIKPYFKERIAYTKRFTKAKYLHHSCGSVYRLIDDLVDCGVEILNPIQPKAADMQPRGLKAAYGEKIVFHGGIDTQELLPFASESQIEEAVHETIEILNRDGGYIFAAAHNIQPDVNPQPDRDAERGAQVPQGVKGVCDICKMHGLGDGGWRSRPSRPQEEKQNGTAVYRHRHGGDKMRGGGRARGRKDPAAHRVPLGKRRTSGRISAPFL